MTIRWPFLRVRQESVCRKRGLEATEHCAPADWLNRCDFLNQKYAPCRTTPSACTLSQRLSFTVRPLLLRKRISLSVSDASGYGED
jgi:hypothetical protein